MTGLIQQVRQRAQWHVRQTLMGVVGVVLVMIGGGFGVAAFWLAIEPQVGAVGASLILGAVFAGVGLVMFSLSGASPHPPVQTGPERERGTVPPKGLYRPKGDHPPLMEAFLLGVSVYLETRGKGRRH